MKLENLGHESWLLHTNKSKILIDPLLNKEFGTNKKYMFVKTSHCLIKDIILKQIDAVVLTTDHFQHCDLASLDLIDKKTRVYVSETFSIETVFKLRSSGFTPIICKPGEVIVHNDTEFVFVPGDKSTYFWDSRVCSLMVASASENKTKKWIFLQSDTSINKELKLWIPSTWDKKPSLVIIVCHYKEYEEYGHFSWDNLISHPLRLGNGPISIDFVSTIFPIDTTPLNIAAAYILSGGDYERKNFTRPKATLDNNNIAELVNQFLVNSHVYVARPGIMFSTETPTKVSESICTNPVDIDLSNTPQQKAFFVQSLKTEFHEKDEEVIKSGLKHLAKALLLSKFGNKLLFTNDYLETPLNSDRFCMALMNGEESETYSFCFSKGSFLKKSLSDDELLKYPSGIILDKSSLLNVLNRETTIAEALTTNIIQWYIGTLEDSPLALFYTAFSKLAYPEFIKISSEEGSVHGRIKNRKVFRRGLSNYDI